MEAVILLVMMMMMMSLWGPLVVVSGKVEASIKNRLGSGKNMTVHCQSKDDDLGLRTVPYDDAFSWEFGVNAGGTTLFYCVLGWESVGNYQFDAYSFGRDRVRCETRCEWLISVEGIYGLNGETGLLEYFYHWPIQ
ncbi:hypothetical protein L484_017865 [Morus notabilis]|uniref:S-protein homolog n=1 Tax=Morus notabilis TaxID=981085 RepID=W9S053_9ROSA|nr:self-incompatibility protein S1 [Morus notabilis]EXC19888.1 hypothetical protein L484_017865 [Morus notabilis]